MNQENIKNKNTASWIAVIVLLLAIPSDLWPYSYYTILRWIITGIAIFIWTLISNLKDEIWGWMAIGIAVLFNPIIPIHLDKDTWVLIDFIAAIFFLIFIFKVKNNEKEA